MARPIAVVLVALAALAPASAQERGAGVKGRPAYLDLVRRQALEKGAPPDLADAVAQIESGYDPGVVGTVGEIGLMQVRPATAAMLGFSGTQADLARPEVNVRYGVAYLAKAWRLAEGDLCRALMKYRAGHGSETISPLSATYCRRARVHLAGIGSPLALGIAPPAVAQGFSPPAALPRVARAPAFRRGTPEASRAFWAAHEARVRAISARITARWRARGAA